MVRQGRPWGWKDAAPAGVTIGGEQYVLSSQFGGLGLVWTPTKGDLILAGAGGAQKVLAAPLTPTTIAPLLGDPASDDGVRWGTRWDILDLERKRYEMAAFGSDVWLDQGIPNGAPGIGDTLSGSNSTNNDKNSGAFIRDTSAASTGAIAGWEVPIRQRWKWNATIVQNWRTQLATNARFWVGVCNAPRALDGVQTPITDAGMLVTNIEAAAGSTGEGVFIRSSGSWIDDGYRVGLIVHSEGFAGSQNGEWYVLGVTATDLTVRDDSDLITAEAAEAGQTVEVYPTLAAIRADSGVSSSELYTVTCDGESVEAQASGVTIGNTTTYTTWMEIDTVGLSVRFFLLVFGTPNIYYGMIAEHSTVYPGDFSPGGLTGGVGGTQTSGDAFDAVFMVESLSAAQRHMDGGKLLVMTD